MFAAIVSNLIIFRKWILVKNYLAACFFSINLHSTWHYWSNLLQKSICCIVKWKAKNSKYMFLCLLLFGEIEKSGWKWKHIWAHHEVEPGGRVWSTLQNWSSIIHLTSKQQNIKLTPLQSSSTKSIVHLWKDYIPDPSIFWIYSLNRRNEFEALRSALQSRWSHMEPGGAQKVKGGDKVGAALEHRRCSG